MSIFAKAKKARENKKGFTLVELIVVLVILAILAAILVPALLGWIDKAKEKQIVLNAKVVFQSTQTVLGSMYGDFKGPVTTSPTLTEDEITEIAEIADLGVNYQFDITYDTGGTNGRNLYKVKTMIYTEGTYTLKYDGASWKKDATAATTYSVTAANEGTVTP